MGNATLRNAHTLAGQALPVPSSHPSLPSLLPPPSSSPGLQAAAEPQRHHAAVAVAEGEGLLAAAHQTRLQRVDLGAGARGGGREGEGRL